MQRYTCNRTRFLLVFAEIHPSFRIRDARRRMAMPDRDALRQQIRRRLLTFLSSCVNLSIGNAKVVSVPLHPDAAF